MAAKYGVLVAAMLVSASVSLIAGEQPTVSKTNNVRVLLDSKCHQGAQHLGTNWPGTCQLCGHKGESPWKGKRLAGLQSALESNGYAFEVSDITESNLSTVSILVVAGRGDPLMFSINEIEAIRKFVQRGGSLLLTANHQGLVAPQNQLTKALGLPVTFNQTTVGMDRQKIELDADHPISTNCKLGLKIRTSCTMTLTRSPHATVIASYSDPALGVFAVAVDRPEQAQQAQSRTVLMPSSGHIASLDDSKTDLWGSADNATWMLNIFDWLAFRFFGTFSGILTAA